jgi:hypothetical protein
MPWVLQGSCTSHPRSKAARIAVASASMTTGRMGTWAGVLPSPIACRVLRAQIASFRRSIGAGPTEPAYERARIVLWAFGGVRVFIDISIMPLFCPQTTIALTACTTFSMLPGDG